MLAVTPLSTWAIAMAALPVADDLETAVRAGWSAAARGQRDVEWGRALGLLELLPHAEAEARAAAADDLLRAAEPLRWTWGPELSRAVVASIRRGTAVDVSFVGFRIDPHVDLEGLRELGGRGVGRLCDVALIRAAMLSEFA